MGNRSEILSTQRSFTIQTNEAGMVSFYLFGNRGDCIFDNAVKWHFEEVGILAIKGFLIATWQEPEVTVLTAYLPPTLSLPHFRCSYNGVLFRETRYESRLD